jgi:hypothetical protein
LTDTITQSDYGENSREENMTDKEDVLTGGNESTPQKSSPNGDGGRMVRFAKAVAGNWRLIFTLVLLFLIALTYQWKIIAVEKAEQEKKLQKRLLTEKAGQLVAEKNKLLLRLTAIPLAWVVRTEMARSNYDSIDEYFNYLVKQDRFRLILLARSDGKIIVATDKRMEGSPVSKFYPLSVLTQTETSVNLQEDGSMMAVTPVMGLAGNRGVLILMYSPETLNLEIS